VTITVDSDGDGMFEHVFTSGSKLTHMPGDISSDGIVDMQDISLMIDAFLTYPAHPLWDERCDIDSSGEVDMMDITLIIEHYGKTYI
jgi:hypothetical protein